MKIIISKRAAKFLQSINDPEKSNMLNRIRIPFTAISNKDMPTLQQFDIKNIKRKLERLSTNAFGQYPNNIYYQS